MRLPDLNIQFDYLLGLSLPLIGAIVFSFLIFVLSIYILIYQRYLRARQRQLERWNALAESVIYEIILYEDDNAGNDQTSELLDIISRTSIEIPSEMAKQLTNKNFRKLLIKKLIAAKLNMSGTASSNLTRLFRQLQLDRQVLKMLNSSSWYKIASAIQQIGVMELDEYKHRLFEFVDHQRGLIRVEAHNAILKFYGFEGLRFLDNATYPITKWQQIKLLDQLASLPTEHFTGIEVWLESKNDTIVLFALKLVQNYHRFELFDQVVVCLRHNNPMVRQKAISVLKNLPSEKSAEILTDIYFSETANNQLAILRTLELVSTDTEIPFLVSLLSEEDHAVKLASAKALAAIGPAGIEAIQSHPASSQYPLTQIIAQILEEAA